MTAIHPEDQVLELENEILRSRGADATRVEELCRELITMGEEFHIDAALGFGYYFLGENYYLLNDVRNCFHYMMRGLEVQRRASQWVLAARSYNLLAVNSINQGNAPFAIDYFLSGLDCCELCDDKEEQALINTNLGFLFLQNGDDGRAGNYAKEAIRIYESLANKGMSQNRNLIMAHILHATAALVDNNLEDAMRARRSISEISLEKDTSIRLILSILDIRIANRMGGPEIIERKLKYLLEQSQKDFPVLEVADELLQFCEDLLGLGRYEELEQLLEVLTKHLEEADILHLRLRGLRVQLDYFEATGQKEEMQKAALQYFRLMKRQEKENKYTVGSMLEVRLSLDALTKKQKQIEAMNRELTIKSEIDALTGLPNRFKLNEWSEDSFEYAYATRTAIGMEILDVDFFKEFNDTYGHAAGDHCLRTVSDVLKNQTEDKRVFAARYGGDEFMVIYRDMSADEVKATAQRIKDEIAAAALPHEASKVSKIMTISQGIYYGTPVPGNKMWDFLHAADEALYEVKRATRNGIHFSDHPIQAVRE